MNGAVIIWAAGAILNAWAVSKKCLAGISVMVCCIEGLVLTILGYSFDRCMTVILPTMVMLDAVVFLLYKKGTAFCDYWTNLKKEIR